MSVTRKNRVPAALAKPECQQVVYWVKSEIIEQGVVPVALPSSFSLSSLLKISAEVADNTKISFGEWLNASRKCLGIQEDIATALFDSFETINFSSSAQQLEVTRNELDLQRDPRVLSAVREEREVGLPLFLIFLFMQLYHRNLLASPRHEVWPTPNSPSSTGPHSQPMLSPTRAMALSTKVTDHEDQLQFVKRHLYDMLCLLAMNKYKVTYSQVQDFSLIMSEGENLTTETPFGSLMPFWQKKDGQIDCNQQVDISVIQTFLNQRLQQNVMVYPPVELPGGRSSSKILWPQEAKAAPHKDSWSAKDTSVHHPRVNSISGVTKSLFVRTAEDINPHTKLVRIFCNHQANIYLLLPLHHVSIFGCTNCTIILGTVQKIVNVEHCEKVRIVCCARAVRISNSVDTRIYSCLNTRPVLCSGNRNVELAPYNTHYASLEHHLQQAGVNPRLNHWDQPLCLGKDKLFNLLNPQFFTSIAVPFNLPGKTHSNPCPLPPEYAQELRRKVYTSSILLENTRQVSAKYKADKELMRVIQQHFREWLISSGNLRQVLDLLYYDDLEAAPATPDSNPT
eukprot:TRINITY_DN27687_c0_g1_i1.p1 TRINITY_DN27687_c0_g1~~TRINITY_DN27687_c0_g1_i1.p1  ORF type:complete len:567 (+),score=24.30 TRINITY_DN27687_c0_g1_i1:35-1735(+)